MKNPACSRFFPFRAHAFGSVHGFTLLEVLVSVVVIAAVLMALLAFTVGGRDKAAQTRCVGNLRQLAAAHLLYAGERGSYMAFDSSTIVNGKWNYEYWPLTLHRMGYIQRDRHHHNIYWCPAFPSETDRGPEAVAFARGSAYVHYGYNHLHVGGSERYGGPRNQPARVSEIKRPARTILLVDSVRELRDAGVGFRGSMNVSDTPENTDRIPHARHHGAVHVAFCDGHVARIEIRDPENPWAELGKEREPGSLWKRDAE